MKFTKPKLLNQPSEKEMRQALMEHMLNVLMIEMQDSGKAPNGVFLIPESKFRAAASKTCKMDFFPEDASFRLHQMEK
jgi:hypothetical protein